MTRLVLESLQLAAAEPLVGPGTAAWTQRDGTITRRLDS